MGVELSEDAWQDRLNHTHTSLRTPFKYLIVSIAQGVGVHIYACFVKVLPVFYDLKNKKKYNIKKSLL